jgi:VWFA-related protein
VNQPVRRAFLSFIPLLLLVFLPVHSVAQSTNPKPTPTVDPKAEGQERVRVFTEEVRLPVTATDTYGHYDPTLEVDDVLVLEDGQPQTIRSVRHIPGNILLILDTGGDTTSLSGLSKKTSLTRAVALRLISRLPRGDRVAVLQSSSDVDVLQTWTDDVAKVAKILETKMFAGKRSRIFEAMARASQMMADQPEGSRHVVLITDGVESPGGKVKLGEAISKLVEARATVHIISYTTFVRQKNDKQAPAVQSGQRPVASDPIAANDPTLPPGVTRSPTFGVSVTFDPAMKKLRKAYEDNTRDSEKWLTDLAEETGGRIFLPTNSEEMVAKSEEVAGQIGAEYIVTYRPTRPLAIATPGEYRKVEVGSRRVGLYLRSRRGYVVPVVPR